MLADSLPPAAERTERARDAASSVRSTTPSGGFRRDIEGLRAITALLVASFHIWGDKVSGGVDVFFVVSGFFITATLLGHVHRYGRVLPGRYLARLGQRLGPMALVVLAATIALTWLVLPAGTRDANLSQVLAASFSVENLLLAFQSVDYLAADEPRSALQQFWAMSVQGQFYVLWLVLVVVAVWAAARSQASTRAWFGVIAVAVGIASLAWSITQTADDQAFAYFSPLTRVWEFALGALVALTITRLSLPRPFRILMVWTGVAGIVSCAALAPVESAFPGWAALWPTLSAALILWSGQKGDGMTANAFLSHPWLVRMGGFAFGVYLWHWPLLIAARAMLGREEMGWRSGAAILICAILLAWGSSRWIERPVIDAARDPDPRRRRRANLLLVTAWAVVVVTAASFLVSVRIADAASSRQIAAMLEAGEGACFGAGAVLAGTPDCVDPDLDGQMLPEGTIGKDLQAPYTDCTVMPDTRAEMCVYGAVGSERRIALIGNSHAISWFPALERVATAHGWELRVWNKNGCTFATPQRAGTDPGFAKECDAWVADVRADLLAGPRVAWAFTSTHQSSRWNDDRGTASAVAAEAAFERAWGPLIEGGTDVVVVRDYPKSSDENLACVERSGLDAVSECTTARVDVLDGPDEMWHAASGRIDGAHAIDLTHAFCEADTCWTAAGHVKTYRDRSHLSNTYAATLASELDTALRRAGLVAAVDRGDTAVG